MEVRRKQEKLHKQRKEGLLSELETADNDDMAQLNTLLAGLKRSVMNGREVGYEDTAFALNCLPSTNITVCPQLLFALRWTTGRSWRRRGRTATGRG